MVLGARSARLAPQPPPADGAQVYVVVVDRTAEGQASAPLRIEQLPAGCTRGELADRLHARAAAPAYLRVLVRTVYGFLVCQLPALQAQHVFFRLRAGGCCAGCLCQGRGRSLDTDPCIRRL